MKLIEKIDVAKFRVTTPHVKDGVLELDFNPIISQFDLKGNFTLIHWQARPKGHRQWGIYTSKDDNYRSMEQLKINFATVQSLQLNDATAKSIPSAVLYTDEDKVTCINEKTVIGDVLLSDVA
ncbi:MAG: hypothetical protein AAFY16_02115 [Cyanobacteria bacterium J06642_3]